jgi:uncharacterized protein DUF397
MADPSKGVASPHAGWYRSTFCENNGCVEVAFTNGQVEVRNSTDRWGAALRFTPTEWEAFLSGVRNAEFDLT